MADERLELALARSAFVKAHGRLQGGLARRDLAAWYAALGETLWWIFALDEHYLACGGESYAKFRDHDVNGRVILGLRLARNRVGHQIAVLLEDPPGHAGLSPDLVTLEQLRWRRLSELPEGRSASTQERAYRECLEGNVARYAIRRANCFFVRHHPVLEKYLTS